jgi:hypothetical protein
MCVAQGRWIEIYGSGPAGSGNSINRDSLGKRKLFFHSSWQRILPYGKDSNKQKGRIFFSHDSR